MSGSIALSLLGGGGSAATADAATAVAALRRASTAGAETKGIASTAKDAAVKLAVTRFKEGISRAKDVETALRDPRVAAVLLPALGLPDATDVPGLTVRALTSDPTNPKSVVAKLSDTRWKSAATTLNLAKRGMDALRDPAVQAKLIDGYTSYQWRLSKDGEASGISDALYFEKRMATGKAPSVYEVLGDAVLRRVVTGALGLPDSLAIQEVTTQARAVTSRIDLSKLTDPKQAAKLAERYVMAANNAGSASSPLLSLFG